MDMFENQIKINDKMIDLKPIKMKYIKNNFYGCYSIIKKEKTKIFKYKDGFSIFEKFLEAILDDNKEIIEYLTTEIDNPTLVELFPQILEKVKTINKFEDDDPNE